MVLCIKIFKSTRMDGVKVMIKLKDLIKENVQLPNGVQIQMGKIFTGEGRAFVKEEDIESVKEAGMGILTSDQADILQGIVLRNKNKNLKGILNVALKSGHFKNVDKKELLGYIDGAKQFVKYMKSHPMG